jgi:hypothetical protein
MLHAERIVADAVTAWIASAIDRERLRNIGSVPCRIRVAPRIR